METLVQCSDGVSGTEHELASASVATTSTDTERRPKRNNFSRSGSLNKQDEVLSGFPIDDWSRAVKAAKIVDDVVSSSTAAHSATAIHSIPIMRPSLGSISSATATRTTGEHISSDSLLFRQHQQQRNVLSFSPCSTKSESVPPPVTGLSYLPPHMMMPAQAKNAGYHSGGLNSGNGRNSVYLLGGIAAGPFTPAQWLELEQQALIYKYITANQPIPLHLLIPIQKALQSAGFYGFNSAHLKPTSGWGWGSAFHLGGGYSNSTDPEPGRCRRTDGKKWRCSRDSVPDQKYCERHMNRGRHRSRKLVEGLNVVNGKSNSNGHSGIPGTKFPSLKLASSNLEPGVSSFNSSFDFTKSFQSPSSVPLINRMVGNRETNSCQGMRESTTTQLSFLPQSINLNTTTDNNSFSITKSQYPYEESNPGGFGVHSCGSIFSTTSTNSTNSFSNNYCSSSNCFNNQATDHVGLLWPPRNTPTNLDQSSNLLWPTGLHSQSQDKTQLSISLPMAPTDFMSSTSSPIHEKSTLSPLRLSSDSELGRVPMSLGVGLETNNNIDQYHHHGDERQAANWIPISWEGGPLGEALHSTTTSGVGNTNSTAAWSPTGVLQRSALVSLSNSSAGSSPRADNSKTIESGGGFSLCSDLPLVNVLIPSQLLND